MWLILSFLSAIFASLTTISIKIGIKNVNSNFATFYRTCIVVIFSFLICWLNKSLSDIRFLSFENWLFLFASGISTGFSWLFYNKAIQLGNVSKVAPIDKSSFILTSILFFIFFFDDTTNNGDFTTIVFLFLSMILMGGGTFFMIDKKKNDHIINKNWIIYAILSSFFASLVSIFIKIGLENISSNLGTLIRTFVVFLFSLSFFILDKDCKMVSSYGLRNWIFLTLSGLLTGSSWLIEYYLLGMRNVNPIAVNSISKLSILFTMLFSYLILKEKFSKRSIFGLLLLVFGIIIIIIFSF